VFFAWAALVVAIDLGTKHLAAHNLGGPQEISIIDGAVRLVLVHNTKSAFGVSLGTYTWQINLVLTAIAMLLAASLARPLVAIDRWAPVMLGLIAGAAGGNLYSLIVSPRGVVDFLAINRGDGRELVLNFADVAAAVGLILVVRTIVAVVRLIRVERRAMLRG
jgi:signal peptidase II